MKNKVAFAIALTLALGLPNINCSKDGGDIFFIPLLQNQWYNVNDPLNDFFNISDADQPNMNISTFSGEEDNSGALDSFYGSFNNHNIQFTYAASSSKAGVTYSGTINDSSTQMNLHSSTLGDLVIRKP